jgi:hypothetical protein
MTIAAGHPILASDITAAIAHAQFASQSAQSAAAAADTMATTAEASANPALEAANTAAANAAAARALTTGLQQQILNDKANIDANAAALDIQTAQIGALTARVTALETGGVIIPPPPDPPDPPVTTPVPNSPTNPTSTAVTSASVSLSATAPSVGGPATGYTVRRAPAGTGTYTDAVTVAAPTVSAQLSGLAASTAYDIVVRSSGAAGVGGQTAPITRTTLAATVPPSGGPGTGPAFRQPANPQSITGGVASAGMDISNDVPGWPGKLLHAIKPYFYSGVWRNNEGGPGFFCGGLTAGFIQQGVYLYDADIPRTFTATGLPPTWPADYPINGSRLGIRWWTYGTAANGGVDLEIYAEPDLANAPLYDVINDYRGPSRGDTFGVTPNIFGRGRCVQTSWGSYYDLTQDPRGPATYGLGWVAFNGYNMTMDQIQEVGF